MGETLNNDVIFVAVNQDVRESKSTLLWALETLHVKKLCLLHVHLPFSFTPSFACRLDESEINAIQESELKTSYDSLHKYRDLCTNKGVNEDDVDRDVVVDVDISLISGYGVGEGIVELIYQNNIKKLVMGAAADPHYSRGMSTTSRKAEYVSQHAPHCCTLWFICKGKLIKTRDGYEKAPEILRIVVPEDKYDIVIPADSSPCVPHNFLCPISMEIMRDPHVAADGFTYEANEIRTWLSGGNHTSPITGARLAHQHLIPNYNLRALIKDWLEQHPNYKH